MNDVHGEPPHDVTDHESTEPYHGDRRPPALTSGVEQFALRAPRKTGGDKVGFE
jgi:hypothetical protein